MSIVKFWICVVGILIFGQSLGQSFENIRTRVDDDKIIIFYDLVTFQAGSKVMVRVFSSHNHFMSPLENVTGDIGLVVPGPNRRIVWTAGALAQQADQLIFSFQGDTFYDLKFIKPTPAEKIIRGKSYTIEWMGGHPDDKLVLTLFSSNRSLDAYKETETPANTLPEPIRRKAPKADSVVLTRTKNNGSFVWEAPRGLKPGKGYRLKISGENESVIEQRFVIRRKTPLMYYGIPVIGAALIFIFKPGPGEQPLPDAPKPG